MSMKAFAVSEYKPTGDLSALQAVEVPVPTVTGHDLLVKVKAVATNPIDYKVMSNLGNHEAEFDKPKPLVTGWDVSGVVSKVGEEASLFKVGDEVFFAGDIFRDGAYAEYVVVDERIVGKKPSKLSWSQAAAEPLTNLTAYEALVDQLGLSTDPAENRGKTILITGGAGGAATASIQLAKKYLGLTVIATGSRDDSIQYVKKMGADHVINHHKSLTEQLKELGITELDYIMDCYGLTPELFTEFTQLIKPFGGIVSIWAAATVDLLQLHWKAIKFSAEFMFTRAGLKDQRQHDILTTISELLDAGTIIGREQKSLPLTVDNLKEALVQQASGKSIGKTTLYFED